MAKFTEQIEHQDLLMFINSCFAGTSQADFYSSSWSQKEALDFLHWYICANYRSLYAATLALGINHHNQQRIIFNLLATPCEDEAVPEAALMQSALKYMPPQRVYKLFAQLAESKINKRRVKACMRDYLKWRNNLFFDAIKYRRLMRLFLRHSHLPIPGEIHQFLFGKGWKQVKYTDPLLETFRQAHFSAQAIYQLPYSIADGLAGRMGIKREDLLKQNQAQLTQHERLRLQNSASESRLKLDFNPEKVGLTQLCKYILSLPQAQKQEQLTELEALILRCRQRFVPGWLGFEKLALVLDNSYSSSGSRQKQHQPLALALAAHYLLESIAKSYKAFWLRPPTHPILLQAQGATALADSLLDALEWGAKEIIIVSDGAENNPAGGVHWLLESIHQSPWKPVLPKIIHLNPSLNPEHYQPHRLSVHLPTLGIRDAENIPGLWILALFASKVIHRQDLETYLKGAAHAFLRDL